MIVSKIRKSADKSKVEIDELISELKEVKKDKEQIKRKYTIFQDKYKVLLKGKNRNENDWAVKGRDA